MSTTTKATVRNGRSGSKGVFNANHNTLAETRAKESHIDHERTSGNIYVQFQNDGSAVRVQGGYNAKEFELGRYEYIYGEGLKAQNERHELSRHKERCKTMEQVYQNKKTAPMETILQVGNSKSDMDPRQQAQHLWAASCGLVNELRQKYGKNLHMLDMSMHLDEQVPHIHLRYTFAAHDPAALIIGTDRLVPNQTKALKEMGFEAPEKDKARSRYNNPLIAFTDATRERFYALCEERGIHIDREVKSPSQRHQSRLESRCEALKGLYEAMTQKAFPEMEQYMRNRFIDTYEVRSSRGGTKPIREFYEEFAARELADLEQAYPDLSSTIDDFRQYSTHEYEDREW